MSSSKERHAFPTGAGSSSSSSSTTSPLNTPRQHTPSNASISVSGSSSNHHNAPITAGALLRAAAGDYGKALDKAVEERNTLASQNSQLWKLIEKQRTGYSGLMKELERVRGERESWKTKAKVADDVTPRNSTTPSLQHARSQEPVMPQRKSSLDPSKLSLVVPPRSESLPVSADSPSTSSVHSPQSAPNEHVMAPPIGYSAAMAWMYSSPPGSSHASTSTITADGVKVTAPTPTQPSMNALAPPSAAQSRDSRVSIPDEAKQFISNMPDSPAQPAFSSSLSVPSRSTTTGSESDHSSAGFLDLSEDSSSNPHSTHTTPDLPSDEEDDNPARSASKSSTYSHTAQADDFPLPPSTSPHAVNSAASSSSHGAGSSSGHGSTVGHGALPEKQAQLIAAQREAAIQQQREAAVQAQREAAAQQQREAAVQAQREAAAMQQREIAIQQQLEREHAEAELEAQKRAVREAQAELERAKSKQDSLRNAYQSPPPSQQSHNTPSSNGTQSLQPQRSDPSAPGPLLPATFRSLPLLNQDLPTTKVIVSQSFVRANDRGKEVLSFLVTIEPSGGLPPSSHLPRKEVWKVQKLFSDVLGLDARLRSQSKALSKKLPNLPEGKLWNLKDAAPSRVDQRKAVLMGYLQGVVDLSAKTGSAGKVWADEIIAFLTSDIVRNAGMEGVMREGHKEGYLTKRGKNFGGWKTRYFVLQGPVLEYYESRGGAHLGSIHITGAQIGRQQKSGEAGGVDSDDKEYRHAFLIVEAKKGRDGNHPRHVLCAESDAERDAWVEMLVRYFTGQYSEESVPTYANGAQAAPSSSQTSIPYTASQATSPPPTSQQQVNGRTSTSSAVSAASTKPLVQKGSAVPISSLAGTVDAQNPKLFDYAAAAQVQAAQMQAQQQGRGSPSPYHPQHQHLQNVGQPSSLPTETSPLGGASGDFVPPTAGGVAGGVRSNSEMGHYPDLMNEILTGKRHASPEKLRRPAPPQHSSSGGAGGHYVPTSSVNGHSPTGERPATPEQPAPAKKLISGPMNGQPIPAGYKFGGGPEEKKDSAASESEGGTPSKGGADRREKAKSRGFWGFGGRGQAEKPAVPSLSRPVFGVTLDESLEVAQIASLPSIVFRCIQYLEAKKAETEEGIYRLSGSSAVIKALKDRFNAEGDVDLLAADEYWDPHAIAGLLKTFLRELPASILTRELHLRFLSVIDFVDPQERIQELSQLIAALPIANYSLLRALTAHLILIVKNSTINKMTMRNVGIVFSPTLGIPAGVFSLMLGEFNRVFNVDAGEEAGEESSAPEGDQNNAATTSEQISGLTPRPPRDSEDVVDRRNSRQYSDAAADQLLGLTGRGQLSTPAEDDGDEDDDVLDTDSVETDNATDDDREMEDAIDEALSDPQLHISPPDTPTAASSGSAATAASKGLNIQVTHSERGNRHSRMMGLPSSPRPGQTFNHSVPPISEEVASPPF